MLRTAMVLLLLTQTQPLLDGIVFRDREYGYTLRFPHDWVQIPNDEIEKALDSALSAEGRSAAHVLAAFQPSRNGLWDLPYVTIHLFPCPRGTALGYETMRDMMMMLTDIRSAEVSQVANRVLSGSARENSSSVIVDPPRIDLPNRTYTFSSSVDLEGVGKVVGVARGRFCPRGAIHVVCFCRQAEYEDYRPTLAGILDGFEVSPFEMKTSRVVPRNYDAFVRQNRSWQIKAAVFLVLGAGLFFYIKARRAGRLAGTSPEDPNVESGKGVLETEDQPGGDKAD